MQQSCQRLESWEMRLVGDHKTSTGWYAIFHPVIHFFGKYLSVPVFYGIELSAHQHRIMLEVYNLMSGILPVLFLL